MLAWATVHPTRNDHKAAAIDCWTQDPCASDLSSNEPGTREYAEELLLGRADYAPWMAEELDYTGSRGLVVLDVGSGQGLDLIGYARAGAHATGVDLTPRHVELARAHLEALDLEADVVEGDAERLPFPDNSFDRVSSNGVLHHIPDIERALAEIRRVLRPGGDVRIILYNRRSFHYWLKQVMVEGLVRGRLFEERSMSGVLSRGVEYSRTGARPLVRVYAPNEVRELLTSARFVDVTTTVRHFNASDTPITNVLQRWLTALHDPQVRDRIGRIGGWYVVGRGVKREG